MRTELTAGWELAAVAAGRIGHPEEAAELAWRAACVPGGAAASWPGEGLDYDAHDWWFRVRFAAEPPAPGERLVLGLEGIATVAEVFLNRERVLESDSMFLRHELEVTGLVTAENELLVRCLALAPLLARSRRPRARWRTRLVAERNLRFHRTMLLGRAPGFAPGPAAVGPYGPVWLERRSGVRVADVRLAPAVDRGAGILDVLARIERPPGAPEIRRAEVELARTGMVERAALMVKAGEARGRLTLAAPELWWPHTHGTPALYEARIVLELEDGSCVRSEPRSVGFRALSSRGEVQREGIDLHVNGVPVFARGVVWTPLDLARPWARREQLAPVLETLVASGMNMVRVPGTALYECDAFHDLCDELGLLVWQDFMFANFDYPDGDPAFMDSVRREARQLLERIGQRPSLAVLCGGSEVAQQAAMTGIAPLPAMAPLYLELLPGEIEAAGVSVPYVPSAPWGGELPFRPGQGVANYYGVGAYLRPLEDARRAGVRFAAECLAFSNVPDPDALEVLGEAGASAQGPAWKRGVPRDAGAGWDFEDVRDHYLRQHYDVDPVALRSHHGERYLSLSRQVSGLVMAETLGEWRRVESGCHGALILWGKDLDPGAGWGLLDHRGRPKVACHHVRRALAPVAVWSTDEGLDGIAVHVANDRPEPLVACLRIALYRDRETLVDELRHDLVLDGRAAWSGNVETLLGRFVDASYAYRFGPPAQDLVVMTLEGDGGRLLSQCFRHPAGLPRERETSGSLGVDAHMRGTASGAELEIATRRFLHGVRLRLPGFRPVDDAFCVEPGRGRVVALIADGTPAGPGELTALNLAGRLPVSAGVVLAEPVAATEA